MKTEREGSKKKVMVAIDESECSYHALMWVLDNLKDVITSSPLVIFAAQPTPTFYYTYAAPLAAAHLYCSVSSTPDLVGFIQEQNKKVSLGLLEKAKSICAAHGVKAETVTEAGEPKEVICNAVQDYKINLLVIGDPADGFLKRFFCGSLSDYCLHNANCPVLVVKKPVPRSD